MAVKDQTKLRPLANTDKLYWKCEINDAIEGVLSKALVSDNPDVALVALSAVSDLEIHSFTDTLLDRIDQVRSLAGLPVPYGTPLPKRFDLKA